MNLEEVKQFIIDNKEDTEVQAFVNSFGGAEPATLEVFKQKVQTDPDFKSFMDSEKDQHTSKALETWKANNLDSLVSEQVKHLYPEDDPKDLEMKKLRQEMEDIRSSANREKMTNLALKKASELNVPTDLVDFFVANDEDGTIANIEKFSNIYSEGIQSTLKEKLEGQGDVVPGGNDFKNISPDDFKDMTYTQKTELYSENKSLYDELTK